MWIQLSLPMQMPDRRKAKRRRSKTKSKEDLFTWMQTPLDLELLDLITWRPSLWLRVKRWMKSGLSRLRCFISR